MAFRALLEADLASMARSWVVRIWLILMAAQALITIPISLSEESASESLAGLLGAFPVVWSIFAIMISSGAVSSETGVVADSILSKAVTRYEYILAKFASRLLTIVGLYLLVTLPAAYIIQRGATNGLSGTGVAWGVTLIGMTLVLLTSLAVTFSTLFNRTLVALVVVWFLWYVAGAIFALLEVEYMSPLHIVDRLPAMLDGDFSAGQQWRTLVGFLIPSLGVMALSVLHFARKDL